MFKKILVLLDGSKLAEVVSSYAREMSGRFKFEVDLLHVCKPEETAQLPMRQAYIEHMAEILSGTVGGKSARVQGHIVVGYPPEEILKYSSENNIDIILLATHGVSGIGRWGLGSVADKIIHETTIPVWLVPSQLSEVILTDSAPTRSILVPLDGSRLSEAVIPDIKALIKQRGVDTEIILINVAKLFTTSVPVWGSIAEQMAEDPATLRATAQNYLDGMVKSLQAEGFAARSELLVGDPAEEIVSYAARYKPRLIAMSTHGRSGISRFVFGSVTESVLRRLQYTPLFLVRPPD